MNMKPLLACFLVPLLGSATRVWADPPPKPKADEIDITVLAILASEKHTEINPKLVEFAKLAQIKDSKLTGFRIDRTNAKKLELGQTNKFELVEDEVVEVTVNKERNEKGRITLTIKPPKLNQITYECVCDKFFAMATQHYVVKDKDRQQLFIAVMAKPCAMKK
jgi:hypothetical protein